jgi:hypothetical protein
MMNRNWGLELIIYLLAFLLGYGMSQAFGAEARVFPPPQAVPHTWIQANPNYRMKLPDSATHCCNWDHCLALNPGQVVRVEDGYLIYPSPPFIREAQFFPERDVYYTEPEGEGQYFACALQGKVRCLFVPSLGM